MRTTFSSDEIAELKKNPCVFDCTKNTVYYTVEFKQCALQLQAEGVLAMGTLSSPCAETPHRSVAAGRFRVLRCHTHELCVKTTKKARGCGTEQ
jgi:hypothetical protein